MKSKNFNISPEKSLEIFNKLSKEWWDEEGPLKALHSFNPIRIKYIKDRIYRNSFKGLRILDIGCGGGILCEPLSRLGCIVTGIDPSKELINVAKEHAKKKRLKITYKNTNLDSLKPQKFDLITCMEVLEHTNNVGQIICKSKNFLKKNGFFFGSTINKTKSSYLFAIFFAEKILNLLPRGTHEWEKFIKPNFIKKIFLKNGFYNFENNGVIYNPVKNSWKNSNFSKINYMFNAQRFD